MLGGKLRSLSRKRKASDYLIFYNFVARKPAQSYHVPVWNNSVARLPALVKEFCASPKRPN